MLDFKGVGVKCAHLTLGIACGQPSISVDVHVHRVINRWGYVQTKTPEKTTVALETELPKKYWTEINSLLVPFGKHICTGKLPHCSNCSLLNMEGKSVLKNIARQSSFCFLVSVVERRS